MRSCIELGDYCEFHNFMLEESRRLTTVFNNPDMSHLVDCEKDWIWNEETSDWEFVCKQSETNHIKIEVLKDPILEVIRGLKHKSQNASVSLVKLFKENFVNFDFRKFYSNNLHFKRKRRSVESTTISPTSDTPNHSLETTGEFSTTGETTTTVEIEENTTDGETIKETTPDYDYYYEYYSSWTTTNTIFPEDTTTIRGTTRTEETTTTGRTTSAEEIITTRETTTTGGTTSAEEMTTAEETIAAGETTTTGDTLEETTTIGRTTSAEEIITNGETTKKGNTTSTEETTTAEKIITAGKCSTTANTFEETTTDYDYYDYYDSYESFNGEGKEFYTNQFSKMQLFIDGLSELISSYKIGLTNQVTELSKDLQEKCTYVQTIPKKYGELFDGPILSLSKISYAQLFSNGRLECLSSIGEEISYCPHLINEKELEILKQIKDDIEDFLLIKQFDDGLDDRSDSACSIPEYYDIYDTCKCECHKLEKLIIYNIYSSLKMIENFDIQRGGDLYSWFYNDEITRKPTDISFSPKLNQELMEEINTFEKEILKKLR